MFQCGQVFRNSYQQTQQTQQTQYTKRTKHVKHTKQDQAHLFFLQLIILMGKREANDLCDLRMLGPNNSNSAPGQGSADEMRLGNSGLQLKFLAYLVGIPDHQLYTLLYSTT